MGSTVVRLVPRAWTRGEYQGGLTWFGMNLPKKQCHGGELYVSAQAFFTTVGPNIRGATRDRIHVDPLSTFTKRSVLDSPKIQQQVDSLDKFSNLSGRYLCPKTHTMCQVDPLHCSQDKYQVNPLEASTKRSVRRYPAPMGMPCIGVGFALIPEAGCCVRC